MVCGGPRITHELAKELGYDAGFGAGKYGDDVASFAVTEMVKRGMKYALNCTIRTAMEMSSWPFGLSGKEYPYESGKDPRLLR